MKQFSKIGETKNADSKLRLCFEFEATEDASSELYAVGLLVSQGVSGWHGEKSKRYMGRAYVETDRREDLEAAQAKLRTKGWREKETG
jgi:hypothetical protein